MAKTIYDYLPTYHQIENTNLKGLQPGFVVANCDVKSGCSLLKDKMLENGHICMIDKDGKVDIWAAGAPMFIHFTEPLNTVVNGDRFFAVDSEIDRPRLVQLIPGDEWMSTIDYSTDSKYTAIKEELEKHIIKLSTGDAWYGVDEMPDGTKAYHYMYIG